MIELRYGINKFLSRQLIKAANLDAVTISMQLPSSQIQQSAIDAISDDSFTCGHFYVLKIYHAVVQSLQLIVNYSALHKLFISVYFS